MKKRLSKLALLAVAAAFVLVGFPACGDDDESGEPPTPATATLTSTDIPEDGLALTAGKSQDISATVTVTNTTFTDVVTGLAAGTDISEYITLNAGDNVTATAKLAEAVTGNTMKLTLTVTANENAEDNSTGELKVTLKAPAVTAHNNLDVTEAISYTVKAAEDGKQEEKTPAAALTGNGVSLTSGEAKTVTATVTLTDATFADPIEAANFTAKAG
ncbi:MAG: hypothetical protein K2I74_01750, partial [Treponemataceae bacterium]|nr:hypothetical protein [Treponemataceae bacterium]